MASVSTYLNFNRTTFEAFTFYKEAFRSEFLGIMRHSDVPVPEGEEGPTDADKDLIINIALPIMAGHLLMGMDAPETQGFKVEHGNAFSISLHPDSKEEADRLFNELSAGGTVEMPMQDMFWGDYYGSFKDKFGVGWMINYHAES
jgi:PhnB protein